jgi:hypothetical protein
MQSSSRFPEWHGASTRADTKNNNRTDKSQTFAQKVSKVESILAADSSSPDPVPTSTTTAAAPAPINAEGNSGKGDTVPLTKGAEKEGNWAGLFKK